MGCQWSKTGGGDSQFTQELRAYEDYCKKDPRLQSFDATVRERTSDVIKSLAIVDSEIGSLQAFTNVTDCFLKLNQDVVRFILESKEDIWNHPELLPLVKEYFDSSIKTVEFCTKLESCVTHARTSQMNIKVAITHYEREVELQDEVIVKKYEKTLEELQKFTKAGNPFTPDFFTLFQSVFEQQFSMLKNLESHKRKLDKKIKYVKICRRVSYALFVSVFAAVLIFSVTVAIAAPPVAIALARELVSSMDLAGSWCSFLWNQWQEALEKNRGLVDSIHLATFLTLAEMDNIMALAKKLEMQIESLLQNSELAVREEDVVKLVIDEIKKKMKAFADTLEDLAAQAHCCNRDIIQGRNKILERINNYGRK